MRFKFNLFRHRITIAPLADTRCHITPEAALIIPESSGPSYQFITDPAQRIDVITKSHGILDFIFRNMCLIVSTHTPSIDQQVIGALDYVKEIRSGILGASPDPVLAMALDDYLSKNKSNLLNAIDTNIATHGLTNQPYAMDMTRLRELVSRYEFM